MPIDANTFLYRATVKDPSVFFKPLVIEYPFARASAPIYEYACHEGNYALPNILKGARKSNPTALGSSHRELPPPAPCRVIRLDSRTLGGTIGQRQN